MTTRRESRRPRTGSARVNQRGGARPEVDAVAFALTVQIIVCTLIVLTALATRQLSQDSFARLKNEYSGLVSGENGSGLADYFAELRGMTSGFFEAVESIIGGQAQVQPQPESEAPVTGISEPTLLRLHPGQSGMLPPPEGSTLAPFFLNTALNPPVVGVVTSPFAFRVHPLSGNVDFHNGIDIAAPYGREILSALPGTVERVGEDRVYGNYIVLRHAHNLKTFYAHCSQILVVEGESVSQGQQLATVGSTGMTTGPHLHFAVIVEGLYADPMHGLSGQISEAD
ncbi:MAG: M23 family metallopeptidase [Oscillospiraceae bacterium]|nr:M23 family metallopeptidase [Oscillospiraceae bacterium]